MRSPGLLTVLVAAANAAARTVLVAAANAAARTVLQRQPEARRAR